MKKSFYLLLLIANYCYAQAPKKPVGVFDCAEIKFWQAELLNQFKGIKLITTEDDGIYTSNRILNGFEKCFFFIDESSAYYSMAKASKEFKTMPEAVSYINGVKKSLDQCLKVEKYTIEKFEDHQSVYTKGTTKMDIYIDPQSEIVNDMVTDKIIGYAVKLNLEYRKIQPTDE